MTGSEIHALARLLDGMDYYRLLRVDSQAPLPVIRTAYHRMRRTFHPDAFLDQESELQVAVDRISKRLNEAYLTLRDVRRRRRYDVALSDGRLRSADEPQEPPDAAHGVIAKTPNGQRFHRLALEAEGRGDLVRATSHLKTALTFERGNAALRAKLAELEARRK
jgi:curved DNA-binding protein CbpA